MVGLVHARIWKKKKKKKNKKSNFWLSKSSIILRSQEQFVGSDKKLVITDGA